MTANEPHTGFLEEREFIAATRRTLDAPSDITG